MVRTLVRTHARLPRVTARSGYGRDIVPERSFIALCFCDLPECRVEAYGVRNLATDITD